MTTKTFTLGALAGGSSVLLALGIQAWLTRGTGCPHCAEFSGHPDNQHDPRLCRGYVQKQRQRRLDRIATTGTWEPSSFGNLWLLPGESPEPAEPARPSGT
ncbi:hypothetical protein [Streptomyces luteireticuli]|uniref:hypothetical protein n=1 Tax=Streptomyces luteireticuli TaxID=173858 RepID=UPI003557E040